MNEQRAAHDSHGRLPKPAILLGPLVGAAAVVAILVTQDPFGNFGRLIALVVMLAAFVLTAGLVIAMRNRHTDVLSERETLREQVKMVQEQNHSLRDQLEVLAAMREVGRVISDDVDFCRILDQLFRILEDLLRPEEICVIVREHDTGDFVPRAIRRNGETLFENIDQDEAENVLFEEAVAKGTLQKEAHGGRATMVCPLIVDREVAGAIKFVLNVEGSPEIARKKIDYTEVVINDIARHIALAIKTPDLHDRAIMDGLTGLYSRAHFEGQIKEYVSVARRYSKVLSLIMIDIDHFKRVNDVYGHLVGDVTLNELTSAIKANVRDCDTVYRYGGEEFSVILPETSARQSQIIAERLRKTIEAATFSAGRSSIQVTISLGVAELDPSAQSHEDLVYRADQALFAAKNAGRNSTYVWFDDPRPIGRL